MNNFTKSCGRAYWHSITNCSPSFGSLQSKSIKAVLLLMFFTLSSGALFAQDIDGCMHENLPTQADAEATIDTDGCDELSQIHLIPSAGTFEVHNDIFDEGVYDVSSGFDKTSTHCDWTYYYVFDHKCNNDIKRITVSYHGGDNTAPWLKDKKKNPFPSDQKGLNLCYDDRPDAPSAQDIADLYTDNCEHVKASDMVKKETRVKNDDCGWIEIHTYTIKDYCDSNAFQMSLTFSGSDQSVPEFTSTPMDLVGDYAVHCDEIPAAQQLIWTDNCARGGKVSAEPDDNNFDCSGGYILRTWNIVDDCGNVNSHTQKIDILPANPVKFDETPLDVYVPCADKADVADYFPDELGYSNGHDKVIYNDPPNNDYDYACLVSGSVKAEYTPIEESCGSFQVTYTYDDECNSIVTTVTVHIVDDENPKVLTASDRENVHCDGQGNLAEFQAWLDSYGGADASDNCDNDLTWSNDYNGADIPVLCDYPRRGEGSIFVVFTVSDDCGNESKTGNWFSIVDVTAPVMSPADDYRVVCDGEGNTEQYERWIKENGGASATEECSSITWSNDGPVLEKDETLKAYLKDGCSNYTGTVTVTFRATDDCGNYSESTAVFSIEDSIAPDVVPARDVVVECDSTMDIDDIYNTPDENGGGPNFPPGSNIDLFHDWLWNNGYASATDVCSNVNWRFNKVITGDACEKVFTVTFTAYDDCGNETDTTASFTIRDTMSPVLMEEAHDRDVECRERDVETEDEDGIRRTPFRRWLNSNGGARAWDKCDKDLVWTNDFDGRKFSDECGETGAMTVMFTVTDACGLSSSTSAEFRIRDTEAPYLEQLPDLDFDLDENCLYDIHPESINSIPDSNDSCGDVLVEWSDADKAGTACTNVVTRTWTSTDDCGNVTTKYQEIRLHDNSAPVLVGSTTALNLSNYNACGTPGAPDVSLVAALFDDNCYEPIVTLINTNVITSDFCDWAVQYEYDVRDRCDNVYGIYKVTMWGSDQNAPVLDGTLPKGETGINSCLADAMDAYPGANENDVLDQFKDDCTDPKDLTISKSGPFDNTDTDKYPNSCTWEFYYTYDIYDSCRNVYSFNEYFSGEDKLAPRLNDGVNLTDMSISDIDECKANAPTAPTAEEMAANFTECGDDVFGQDIFVDRVDFMTGNDCNWLYSYEYTVYDACGNTYPTFKIIYTGGDATDPVITECAPDDHRAYGEGVPTPATDVVAVDDCGNTSTQFADSQVVIVDGPDIQGDVASLKIKVSKYSYLFGWYTIYYDMGEADGPVINGKPSYTGIATFTWGQQYGNNIYRLYWTDHDDWHLEEKSSPYDSTWSYIGYQYGGDEFLCDWGYWGEYPNSLYGVKCDIDIIETEIHSYTRTFTVTDDCENSAECSADYSYVVEVDNLSDVDKDLANGDYDDDVAEEMSEEHISAPDTAAAPSDDLQLNFKAYPVPFNKDLSLAYNFDFDTDVTIEVYDTKGLLVKRVENKGYKSGSEATIPMSLVGADQLYYVKLITNRGTVTKKIVSSNVNKQ